MRSGQVGWPTAAERNAQYLMGICVATRFCGVDGSSSHEQSRRERSPYVTSPAPRLTWAVVFGLCQVVTWIPVPAQTTSGLGEKSRDVARSPNAEGGSASWGEPRLASRSAVPGATGDVAGRALLDEFSLNLRQLVARIRPSVVHIEADKPYSDAAYGGEPVTEAGAGVIVQSDGQFFVLTNYHVVHQSEASQVHIFLADSRRCHPDEMWWDTATDVAVLRLRESDLQPAAFGDSENVQIGDFVLAYGSPFGLSHSVSHGIVSAKGRRNLELGVGGVKIQDFLQTDAAINPGNSGGPLMNLRGEVIGLNTAIASNSGGNDGIGFAIPINLVRQVATQLITQGRVIRPYLGIRLDRNFDGYQFAAGSCPMWGGARVNHITAGSPAERAGLQLGDIITQIDGVGVFDDGHLITLVGTKQVNGECRMKVIRDGEPHELSVPLLRR